MLRRGEFDCSTRAFASSAKARCNSVMARSSADSEKSVSLGTAYCILDDQFSKNCHRERSEKIREADVLAKSKDPGETSSFWTLSGNSPRAAHGAGRTPWHVTGNTCVAGSFDFVATSLREPATSLRMTVSK